MRGLAIGADKPIADPTMTDVLWRPHPTRLVLLHHLLTPDTLFQAQPDEIKRFGGKVIPKP